MKFDAVVVGAGATGCAVTWNLSARGLKVACLDRGDWEEQESFGRTYPVWERQRYREHNPVVNLRNNPSDYPINDADSPISIAQYNAIGGSTVIFSGHFPRFRRDDFELEKLGDEVPGWPVDYDSLVPFYEINEKMMSVGGQLGDPYFPEIKALGPPVYLGSAGQTFMDTFSRLGWHIWPSYASIYTGGFNSDRVPCTNLGPCNNGCPTGSKSTADQIYMKPAIELGAELIANAPVTRVLASGGRAYGVEFQDQSGEKKEITADLVILAAGAVGTPRILFNSGENGEGVGLANSSGLVGRMLMMHPMAYVEGLFDEPLDTHIGPQGAFLYSLEFSTLEEKDLRGGYMIQVLRGDSPIESAMVALSRGRLSFGEGLMDSFFEHYRRRLGLSVVVEDEPRPLNRVQPDSHVVDLAGVPGARVQYGLDRNSKRLLAHGVRNAKRALVEAGASRVVSHAPVRKTGWHTMGTARMGEDPQKSVVSSSGETHDVKNLYIMDTSVFSTGSCVNPANTAQALSLLLSTRLVNG